MASVWRMLLTLNKSKITVLRIDSILFIMNALLMVCNIVLYSIKSNNILKKRSTIDCYLLKNIQKHRNQSVTVTNPITCYRKTRYGDTVQLQLHQTPTSQPTASAHSSPDERISESLF
jgi:hypothetical protein